MIPMAAAALGYAARGWPVFPLEPGGKRPLGRLVSHGLKDASTDPDVVRRWWSKEPRANIGLVTGLAFDVFDVDGPRALVGLDLIPLDPDQTIEGPTVATPRGWHCYVAPTGRGNTTRLGGLEGIDWRGAGGYIVAPASVREDGGSWSWIIAPPVDLGPDTPIVPAPQWVLDLFDRRPIAPLPSHREEDEGSVSRYGQAALEREVGRVVMAPEGSRNDTLNRAAMSLGQLVAAKHLPAELVADQLYQAGRRAGLDHAECVATIRSGLQAGLRHPRQVPA